MSINVRAGAGAAALIMLVGSACSGAAESPGERIAEVPQPTPIPDPTCPLTGHEPGGVDLSRPAIAIKVENSPQARPQSGLEDADVVVEEIVEGGITRFMAVYHCGDSDRVGPVRSARFDDAKIVKPFTRLLAFSGSNDIVEKELKDQKIVLVEEITSGGALFRDPPGVLEVHNLFGDIGAIRRLDVAEDVDPPAIVLDFGELPASAQSARKVKLSFSPSVTIEYKWKDGGWKRYENGEPFLSADGEHIAVPNLLVQEVTVNNSESIFDVAGNPSPDIDLDGSGRALLFRDGSVIEGTWKAGKKGTPPSFVTESGEPFVFAEGPTWVALVPSKKGNVKGKIAFR